MGQMASPEPGGRAPRHETYTHGYSDLARRVMSARTAADVAGFLLPHLRPGMSLLDCGCGPGSITLDLAGAVAPGQAIGIDIAESQIEVARALALERGVMNARFEVASVYELPFPDASFDATFANTVLEHVGDPLKALREMRRVLRPGGVVGVRDTAWQTALREPASPLLTQLTRLLPRHIEHNGGSPYYAPRQRHLLGEAGFARTEAFALVDCVTEPERTRRIAESLCQHLDRAEFRDRVIAEGWIDRESFDAAIEELRAWGERSDTFQSVIMCAAIGWVS